MSSKQLDNANYYLRINALSKAGFVIEQMIEQTDSKILNATGEISYKMKKAKMLPFHLYLKLKNFSALYITILATPNTGVSNNTK